MSRPGIRARGSSGSRRTCGSTACALSGRSPNSDPERASSTEPREVREAAGTLLSRLSPQERAAVVLKDAFNFTLEEIAEALSTTPGTVKSALHRGRGKLIEPEDQGEAPPKPQILDAFCAAFNAGAANSARRNTALARWTMRSASSMSPRVSGVSVKRSGVPVMALPGSGRQDRCLQFKPSGGRPHADLHGHPPE